MDFYSVPCEFPPMLLLIPGPVTTRAEVRQALTQDIAPWDNEFQRLLRPPAHPHPAPRRRRADQHACLPLQGCGHFITEAALRSFLPPGGRILIPATGAYADRMIRLAREAGRIPVLAADRPDRRHRPAGNRRRAGGPTRR